MYGSDPDSPSPVLGHGISISHNTVAAADALRGGAIAVDRGWHPPPTPYQYKNTLIHHNRLRDLQRLDGGGFERPTAAEACIGVQDLGCF